MTGNKPTSEQASAFIRQFLKAGRSLREGREKEADEGFLRAARIMDRFGNGKE